MRLNTFFGHFVGCCMHQNASYCIILHHFFDFFCLLSDRLTVWSRVRAAGAKAGDSSRHSASFALESQRAHSAPLPKLPGRITASLVAGINRQLLIHTIPKHTDDLNSYFTKIRKKLCLNSHLHQDVRSAVRVQTRSSIKQTHPVSAPVGVSRGGNNAA